MKYILLMLVGTMMLVCGCMHPYQRGFDYGYSLVDCNNAYCQGVKHGNSLRTAQDNLKETINKLKQK